MWRAAPVGIHQAQIVLCVRIAQVCRLAKPGNGLLMVFWHSVTAAVHQSEPILGICIALFGFLPKTQSRAPAAHRALFPISFPKIN